MKRNKTQRAPLALAMIMFFTATALFLPGLVYAGDLEPSAPPGPTMHTLDEVYHKLDQITQGAAVPKTGQTTSYATGDDGNLQKGAAWPVPRFTDNNNGTVTDNLTGLIWLKQANYNSTSGTTGSTTWANALSFCNALQNGQCGLTDGSIAGDWRLPNIKELGSLIDYGVHDPALSNTAGTGQWTQGDPFTNVQSNHEYWSATTYASHTDGAWCVSLHSGSWAGSWAKTYVIFYVWPVRGGN